jgi:hypothetical protein
VAWIGSTAQALVCGADLPVAVIPDAVEVPLPRDAVVRDRRAVPTS